MSKNINELKDPPLLISDDEFEQWKATAKKGDKIPNEIHRYFKEILIPRGNLAWNELKKASGNII